MMKGITLKQWSMRCVIQIQLSEMKSRRMFGLKLVEH